MVGFQAFIIIFLFSPCIHGLVSKTSFISSVKNAAPLSAYRIQLILSDKINRSPEWMAQYYLLLRQPRVAAREIDKIENPQLKKAFEAGWLALVSIPRPWANACPRTNRLEKTVVSILDKEEIWKDEWEDLVLDGSCSKPMPLIMNGEERARAVTKSRGLFEALPTQYFIKDFSFLCLALDTGAKLPELQSLIVHHASQKETPCFHQLLNIYLKLRPSQTTIQQGAESVQLSALDLGLNKSLPDKLTLPIFAELDQPVSVK